MMLASNGVAAQEQVDFKVWLQQISRSSAVAPVGRVASKPINIMPGNFDKPNRTDAVIITEAGTKYCKGPHFKQCDVITTMPLKTTVAVNETDGRAVLLRMEGPTLFQKCTLDWSRGSASVDCRNISFDALSKYARKQANGVVMIDGTEVNTVPTLSKEPRSPLALDKMHPARKAQKGEAPPPARSKTPSGHVKNGTRF